MLNDDLSHYEILEVSADATPREVERAYHISRATYQPGSPATYSLLSDDEAADALRRIEGAYAVLSDDKLRREYDARLRATRTSNGTHRSAFPRGDERPGEATRGSGTASERSAGASPGAEIRVLEPVGGRRFAPPAPRRNEAAEDIDAFDFGLGESLDPEDGVYEGTVLRRIRISRGIEMSEIASITKINEQYLRDIEANQYASLPATVYLRGFLREVARCLKLDPKRVTESYLERRREAGC